MNLKTDIGICWRCPDVWPAPNLKLFEVVCLRQKQRGMTGEYVPDDCPYRLEIIMESDKPKPKLCHAHNCMNTDGTCGIKGGCTWNQTH